MAFFLFDSTKNKTARFLNSHKFLVSDKNKSKIYFQWEEDCDGD